VRFSFSAGDKAAVSRVALATQPNIWYRLKGRSLERLWDSYGPIAHSVTVARTALSGGGFCLLNRDEAGHLLTTASPACSCGC
jgi:hypothetical protein